MIDDWAGEGYGRRLVNRVGYWNAYDRHTDDILDDALSGGYDSIVFGDFIVVFEGVKIDILDVEESGLSSKKNKCRKFLQKKIFGRDF